MNSSVRRITSRDHLGRRQRGHRKESADERALTMEESFDFGLQRVLDGISLYIEHSRTT